MITKEIVQRLKILNGDENEDKIPILTDIKTKKIDIQEFNTCQGEFTRSLCVGIGSLDETYLSLSHDVMIMWIDLLVEQPKIQIKYYDMLLLHFIDGLFYALNERIPIYISHVIDLISVSHIFITRHLSQFLHTLAFHIQSYHKLILPIIKFILDNVEIPSLLWNEVVLFLYTLYHFEEEEQKSEIILLFKSLHQKERLMTVKYISSYLKSLQIVDDQFYLSLQ